MANNWNGNPTFIQSPFKRHKPRPQHVYLSGQYNVQCDRCGLWYKSSQCQLEWTGLFVCELCYEPRQPQDFLRGVDEHPNAEIPRPDVGLPGTYCLTYTSVAGLAIAGCMLTNNAQDFYLGGVIGQQGNGIITAGDNPVLGPNVSIAD